MDHVYRITKRDDGRWLLIDPDGQPFFSLGVNCLYNQIMDQSAFLGTDMIAKYGGDRDWHKRWMQAKKEQIVSWGFNSYGAWHERAYWGDHFPKSVELRMSRYAKKVNTDWGFGFPDVFDDSFRHSVHKVLLECFYEKGEALLQDKGMIGYYTDNELHWWGSGGLWGNNNPGEGFNTTHLVDDYIEQPKDSAGKQAWVRFLAEKYRAIERLNEAWDSEYIEFDDLLHIAVYRAREAVLEQDKLGFLRRIAEVYFETTTSALKLYDPHRLNLGTRFVGESTPEVVYEVAKDYVDALSFNFYSFGLPEGLLGRVSGMTDKPVMITEFAFCAGRTAGFLRSTNGARNVLVRDQRRRAEAYDRFVKRAAALPYMIGLHWFALYDYGNPNGLIGNYGLLDLKDEPYAAFVAGVRQTHEDLHQGGMYGYA